MKNIKPRLVLSARDKKQLKAEREKRKREIEALSETNK